MTDKYRGLARGLNASTKPSMDFPMYRPSANEREAELQRAAFEAGAIWADEQCPLHKHGSAIEREAIKRYPEAP